MFGKHWIALIMALDCFDDTKDEYDRETMVNVIHDTLHATWSANIAAFRMVRTRSRDIQHMVDAILR